MRYIKVLLLVLIFYVSMIFLFQNQETLGRDMALKLHLFPFFLPAMPPVSLPTYFILLAGFLLGALFTLAFFLWHRLALSAKLMKAQWKVRNLEREVAKYETKVSIAVATPAETKTKFPFKKTEKVRDDITAPDPDKDV